MTIAVTVAVPALYPPIFLPFVNIAVTVAVPALHPPILLLIMTIAVIGIGPALFPPILLLLVTSAVTVAVPTLYPTALIATVKVMVMFTVARTQAIIVRDALLRLVPTAAKSGTAFLCAHNGMYSATWNYCNTFPIGRHKLSDSVLTIRRMQYAWIPEQSSQRIRAAGTISGSGLCGHSARWPDLLLP